MIVSEKGQTLRVYDVIYGEIRGQKLSKISGKLIANIKIILKIIWTKRI